MYGFRSWEHIIYEGKLVCAQLTFGKSLCDIETCRPAQGLEAIHPVGFDGFTQDARQRECGAQLAPLEEFAQSMVAIAR